MAIRRPVVVWIGCLLATTLVVLLVATIHPGGLLDLRVYRTGGVAWLRGIPLYGPEFPHRLPFTYPPISAVLFAGLGAMAWPSAVVVLTAAGLLALSATTFLAARSAGIERPTWVAAAAVAAGLALEPVRDTLMFGQINLVLMGLVATDCLLPRTRYPRGMLIGIAAAMKLTPAIFVLVFLARRQYSAVGTIAATFAGVTGFALIVAPVDSTTYWTSAVFDADRPGKAEFATNQSLRAALHRLDMSPFAESASWLLLAIAVLAAAWLGARRAHEAGDRVRALVVVAAAGLLLSPISWSHHWVWIAPGIVLVAARAYRRHGRRSWPAVLAVTVPFTVGQHLLPHGNDQELGWTWWQHLVGNSYLLAALLLLGWSATARRLTPPTGQGRGGTAPSAASHSRDSRMASSEV